MKFIKKNSWILATVAVVIAIVSVVTIQNIVKSDGSPGAGGTQPIVGNASNSTNYGAVGLTDMGDGNGTWTMSGGSRAFDVSSSSSKTGDFLCYLKLPTTSSIFTGFQFKRVISTTTASASEEIFTLSTSTSATATGTPLATWTTNSSTTPFWGSFIASSTNGTWATNVPGFPVLNASEYLVLTYRVSTTSGARAVGGAEKAGVSGYCGGGVQYLDRF